jgi:hypothetical protein
LFHLFETPSDAGQRYLGTKQEKMAFDENTEFSCTGACTCESASPHYKEEVKGCTIEFKYLNNTPKQTSKMETVRVQRSSAELALNIFYYDCIFDDCVQKGRTITCNFKVCKNRYESNTKYTAHTFMITAKQCEKVAQPELEKQLKQDNPQSKYYNDGQMSSKDDSKK